MKEFNELVEIVSRLRTECPWDREQTHETLAKHLIEEAYELLDALAEFQIDSKNDSMLKDELGDLLLQILLHSK
jgi:tetrapyrrole methylase family protein/MazG family protein